MTYRARNAARRARRPVKTPLTFARASDILKKYYPADTPVLEWRMAYYGFRSFFGEHVPGKRTRGALEALRVPVTLTSLADFEAALYWHKRKLGPDPGKYVKARHAARPYT